jgi:hypothetical protein
VKGVSKLPPLSSLAALFKLGLAELPPLFLIQKGCQDCHLFLVSHALLKGAAKLPPLFLIQKGCQNCHSFPVSRALFKRGGKISASSFRIQKGCQKCHPFPVSWPCLKGVSKFYATGPFSKSKRGVKIATPFCNPKRCQNCHPFPILRALFEWGVKIATPLKSRALCLKGVPKLPPLLNKAVRLERAAIVTLCCIELQICHSFPVLFKKGKSELPPLSKKVLLSTCCALCLKGVVKLPLVFTIQKGCQNCHPFSSLVPFV